MRNIYFAHSDEVFVDIDSERQLTIFKQRCRKIQHLVKKWIIEKKGRHSYHVFIQLKRHHRFADLAVFAQYLGSDIRKTLADMSRIIAGASKPILFIEYTKIPNWREPDIVCTCPPRYRGEKMGMCYHILHAKGHKAIYGKMSTRLRIVGVTSLQRQ
ncbi:MAG: hypothetical protein JRN15_13980 [Nitrososphaerota archaeon]|nr:hypothetical protein [Nitrososphaerota archaeon]